MVRIEASIKRALWRSLVRKIKDAALSLEDALAKFQDNSTSAVKTGRVIVSTSGAGQSVGFAMPQQWLQLTAENVTGLSEEFICMFEKAKDYLSALGQPTTDEDVSDWILSNWADAQGMAAESIGAVTEAHSDFTHLRLPETNRSDLRTW